MTVILLPFCLLPFVICLAAEYALCRFLKAWFWKLLLPAVLVLGTVLVVLGRLRLWSAEQSPVTQLLFIPGLPAFFALLGAWVGWRLWKKVWGPRIVKDKGER